MTTLEPEDSPERSLDLAPHRVERVAARAGSRDGVVRDLASHLGRPAGVNQTGFRWGGAQLVPVDLAARTVIASQTASLGIDHRGFHPVRMVPCGTARLSPAIHIELGPCRRRQAPTSSVVANGSRRVVAEPNAGYERGREAQAPDVVDAVGRPRLAGDRAGDAVVANRVAGSIVHDTA